MTPIHVSDRLFNKVSRYFGSPAEAVQEAVQNAYRSYWPIAPNGKKPVIDVTVQYREGGTMDLSVTDQGRGIDDPGKMLSPAASEWESDVEGDQDPAGLGVCAMLAFSQRTCWVSRFGRLTVESQKFFNDAQYRAQLGDSILPVELVGPGTIACMEGMPQIGSGDLRDMLNKYTNVVVRLTTISPQGDQASEIVPPWLYGPPLVENERFRIYRVSSSYSSPDERFLWHGHAIEVQGSRNLGRPTLSIEGINVELGGSSSTSYCREVIVIEPKFERAITPKLPDRKQVMLDARTLATRTEALELLTPVIYAEALAAIDLANQEVGEDDAKAPTRPPLLDSETWRLLKKAKYLGVQVHSSYAIVKDQAAITRERVVAHKGKILYRAEKVTVLYKGRADHERIPDWTIDGALLNDNDGNCPLLEVGCAFGDTDMNDLDLPEYRLVIQSDKWKRLGKATVGTIKRAVLIPEEDNDEGAFANPKRIVVKLDAISVYDNWDADRGAYLTVLSTDLVQTICQDRDITTEAEESDFSSENEGKQWHEAVGEGYDDTLARMSGKVSLGSAYDKIRNELKYQLGVKDLAKVTFDFDKGQVRYDGKWHKVQA